MSLSIIPATEMQARFTETLNGSARVTCVTHRSEPVLAVVPWSLYQSRNQEAHSGPLATNEETITATEARKLFLSYEKRLSDLQNRAAVYIVTRRQEPIGVIMSWTTWESVFSLKEEDESHKQVFERETTISNVRHRLFQLAEQFKEAQRTQPIEVWNHGEPVFAIVPWSWYSTQPYDLPQAESLEDSISAPLLFG